MMASSAFNGGGFIPNELHQFNDHSNAMQSPSKSKSMDNSTRPVTIKQINDAVVSPQDVTIPIDGISTNEITVVGCILNVKGAETSKVFTLEDGTGIIDAKMWNPTEEYSAFREGIWVRVFGVIKPFNNIKQITINKMRQIVEFNEITYHNLAAIEAHLVFTHGGRITDAGRNAKSIPGNAQLPNQSSNFSSAHNMQSNAYDPYGSSGFSSPPYASNTAGSSYGGDVMAQMISQFTPIQKDIFFFYKQHSSSANGANINDVILTFRGKYDHKDVMKTSQFLIDEGYIYITCDDNHAKCTAF